MTIKEVEERTGLARSNIRFYEKENLILPKRSEQNGYRDYTEEDVCSIKKIAYLRTLGISIENIHNIIDGKVSLYEVVREQSRELDKQLKDLKQAKAICSQMLEEETVSYENLDVEAYIPDLPEYWETNREVFRMDSVSFLYMFGGMGAWILITAACLLTALFTYQKLPAEIPVQWRDGDISTSVSKIFIFLYPLACILIRLWIRPFIKAKIQINFIAYSEMITDYLTNFLCFTALSVEGFTILYVYGIMKHITVLLLADAVVLIGLLAVGFKKISSAK